MILHLILILAESFIISDMSDEALSNDLDARIKITVQYMMHNLISSDLSANTISSLIFELKEIKYYDFKLDI